MRRAAVCALLAGVIAANLGAAQPHHHRRDAGPPDAPTPTPRALVDALRGPLYAIDAVVGRHTASAPREELRALPRLQRDHCYALIGAATGEAQVRMRVHARAAPVFDAVPLANSRGTAVRQDFCVRYPADWYQLTLSVEGPSQWHVALVETSDDAGVPPPPPPPARDAGPAGYTPPPLAVRPEPIGGAAQDYVGNQIRGYARARPRLVGFTPAERRTLATNEAWTARYALPAGRCAELVAAGVPSVGDLVLEIEDPAGHRVAQDGTHRATEAVRHCPRYAGTHTFRVRMFAGAGAVAVQLLIEP